MNHWELTESQFFQGSAVGLRVEEVDDGNLNADEAIVHDQVLPANSVHPNGVDEGCECSGNADPELLNSNTAGSLCEGEELDEVGVREWVVANAAINVSLCT